MLDWPWRHTPPEPPGPTLRADCKHLNSRVFAHNTIGFCFCCDCGTEAPMATVFDNWLKELQSK